MVINTNLLQHVLDDLIDDKKVFGVATAIKSGEALFSGAAGDMRVDSSYFIASTTKLFTTSIILQLRSQQLLGLDDTLDKYFTLDFLKGLHVYQGVDYSSTITIRHLLAHTSGISDYFQGVGSDGLSLEVQLKRNIDKKWSFTDAVNLSKTMQAKFIPGAKNKAFYSDTNYQLLGRIIEVLTGLSYAEACRKYVFSIIGLENTYIYSDASDMNPKQLYYKEQKLSVPNAMASFGADGGGVSTVNDMLIFVEAFFGGKLFPVQYIQELQVWNKIFFPLRSGVGFHLFRLPWLFNPLGRVPDLLGHSGLSGALVYYSPRDNIFISATVNQISDPDTSFRLMIKLIDLVNK